MDNIEYNDAEHYYKLDGKKVPSVTQLAKEFSGLDTTWLEAHPEYAMRGTAVHAELAAYIDGELSIDNMKSELSKQMAGYIEPKKGMQTEVIVYNTELGYAGTADLVCIKGDTVYHIIDFKTGKYRQSLYEQCQLSLYLLALKFMGYKTEDTQLFVLSPTGYTQYEPLSWEQMLNASESNLELADEEKDKFKEKLDRLKELQEAHLEYIFLENELKTELLKSFSESEGATKLVIDNYKFSYISPSVRKSVDTAKLKEDGLFDKYMKETKVSGSVRITTKKDE